jgi:hypothetical protein
VAQLYPLAPGSLYVASYDSRGYGGGIRTRLHAGVIVTQLPRRLLLCSLGTDRIENAAYNSSSIVAGRCLAKALLFIESLPRNEQCLSSHVTISSVSKLEAQSLTRNLAAYNVRTPC